MIRVKRWFAFDNIRRTEDLLDLRIVDTPALELRNGAFVRRRGFNRYEFIHGGSSVTVDLNLGDTEEYLPTYQLGSHTLRREYFSVVHIGEGDGWDVTRPCMGSMICFQGRIYLIDTARASSTPSRPWASASTRWPASSAPMGTTTTLPASPPWCGRTTASPTSPRPRCGRAW